MDSKDHTMKGIKISIKKQKSFFYYICREREKE